jgi:hypothetical protein
MDDVHPTEASLLARRAHRDPKALDTFEFLPRLLLDSRVVDVPRSSTPTFGAISFLRPLCFNGLQNEWRCLDKVGA